MTLLLLILVFVCIVIFSVDALPQFDTWQTRIHIGRFENRNHWQKYVLHRSIKWLQNTPTIPLTDNQRLVILDMLRGNYKRTAIQSWQEGALVLGLTEYVKNTADENVQRQLESFISTKMTVSGQWKEKPAATDHALLAYAFLHTDLPDIAKYKPAFDETYAMILSLKGEDGSIAYKKHNGNFRFVDTIGFICPFLVTYGLKFNQTDAIDLAVFQISEYQQWGMMPGRNIPCHTYHLEKKIPTGLFGWGRGLGWFVIGLIDSWQALPKDHDAKPFLEKIIRDTVAAILPFQRANGSFSWLLFDAGSRADSSTAATLAWFFTLAAAIPEIETECLNARERCLNYLQSVTRRDGAVDFSQGDTKGIGVYSMNFDILPFTQGFTLRTLSYSAS